MEEKKELGERLTELAKARGFVCEAPSGKVKDLQLTFNQKELVELIDQEVGKAREEGRKVGLNIFYEEITQNVNGKNGKKNVRRYSSEKIDDFLNEIKRKAKQEVLEDLFSWTCIPVKGKFIDIESYSRFKKKILSELSKLVK